ncbi:MAG: glycosyltransferase family 4 protein, partial [Acidimicrobiales bacterium]
MSDVSGGGGARPVRVLHVVWRLTEGGGIPVVVRSIAAGVGPGFAVDIVTVRPAVAEDRLEALPPSVRLHHLGAEGSLARGRKLRAVVEVARLGRRLRPDIVHLHTGTALYGGLVRPAAGTILDVHAPPGEGQHGRATERLEGWLARRRWVSPVAHSASVREAAAAAWRLPSTKVELIPLGIPAERWAAPAGGGGPGPIGPLPPGALVVLYVARIVPPKDVGLFVDVAAQVAARAGSPVVFVAVGDGSELPALREEVGRRGLLDVVRFPGTLHGDELVSAYQACHLFLSTSRYESFGLAVLEAMAAGRPVVATAVGGVVEVVDHGRTGLLVPAGDTEGLVSAVLDLLGDAERRARMGQAGRRRAAEVFDLARMVEGYATLYRQVAGGVRRAESEGTGVFLLKSPDVGRWQATMGRPGQLPYRLDHLVAAGIDLRWTDASHRPPWSWPPVRRAVAEAARLGPPFVQTLCGAAPILRSPVTLAMFESEGNFLAWLRRLGVPGLRRRKLVVITC